MNLLALRTEVRNHGFTGTALFPDSRINQYLNDAQGKVCRRVDFYIAEAVRDFNTVAGTATYIQPTDFARDRSLHRTDVPGELAQVGLRTIDRSPIANGAPRYYAIDASNLHLYPTPNNVFPLELRYWKLPAQLVGDTDVPAIPADYHRMLVYWALKECFAGEDDPQTAQYWTSEFNTVLAEFAADVKFPSSDSPNQLADMWTGPQQLGSRGWSMPGSV